MWAFQTSRLGKRAVLVDPRFAERLAGELRALGVELQDDLFFICRSGSRSLAAAEAMAAMGYGACHNVAGGSRARSTTGGIAAPAEGGRRLVCPGSKARNEA